MLGVRRNVSRRSKRTTQNPGHHTTQRQQCRQRHHPPIRRYFTKRILHTARLFRSQPRVLSVQHVRWEKRCVLSQLRRSRQLLQKYHGYNNGGNWGETAATLAGWYGETDEALNPYQTEFSSANADAMYQRGVSSAGQSQLHVSDIEELPAPYSAASRRTTARLTTISWKAAAYRTTT